MQYTDIKKQELCAKILYWSFFAQMIFTISKRLLTTIPYGTVIAAAISFPYLAFLFFKLCLNNYFKISPKALLATVIITALYTTSYLTGTPLEKILLYYPQTIYGLILFCLAYNIKDLKILYKRFATYGFIITLVSILIVFVDRSTHAYNMHFSYILSLILYFHTIEFLKNKKTKNLLLTIIDFLLILIYGSRGPMLCFAVFLVLYIILGNKKFYIKIASCAAISCLAINIKGLLSLVQNFVQKNNVNSRTINLLLEDAGHTSGRELITEKANVLIQDYAASGLGIAGEFKHMSDYPHNLVLELFLHWGVAIGATITIYLFYTIFNALIKSRDEGRMLMLIFISYGFVVLFFSGTYLSWDGLFILLGIAYNIIHARRC